MPLQQPGNAYLRHDESILTHKVLYLSIAQFEISGGLSLDTPNVRVRSDRRANTHLSKLALSFFGFVKKK